MKKNTLFFFSFLREFSGLELLVWFGLVVLGMVVVEVVAAISILAITSTLIFGFERRLFKDDIDSYFHK